MYSESVSINLSVRAERNIQCLKNPTLSAIIFQKVLVIIERIILSNYGVKNL